MPPRTEQAFQDLKDSGLTHIYIDYTEKQEIREEALSWCDRYGMKAIIMCCWGRDDNPSFEKVTRNASNYACFDGVNGLDEPLWEEIDGIEREYEGFAKAFPDKTFYTNLVNCNVPHRFVSAREDITYEDMYQRYGELIKKMQYDRTVSMTIYPLLHDGDKKWLLEKHLIALKGLSDCAKACDAEMYFFVQAMPFRTTHRTPYEEDIRFQVNSGLAFGAKGLQYFCYRTPDANWEFSGTQYSMVKIDGEKTHIYYAAQKVNAELQNGLAKDYFHLHYLDTYSVKGEQGESVLPFQAFHKERALPQAITYFRCSRDCIVGAFASEKGGEADAFYIVNYTDPSYHEDNYVEFSLKGKTECTLILRGEKVRVTASFGKFCVLLKAGDGVLVQG